MSLATGVSFCVGIGYMGYFWCEKIIIFIGMSNKWYKLHGNIDLSDR